MCYVAAAKIGCSPKTIQRRLKGSPKVAEARDDERGKFVDICEMTLKELVYEKDLRADFFALRMLGRDRGYGNKIIFADEGTRLELIEEIVTVPASTNANPPDSAPSAPSPE